MKTENEKIQFLIQLQERDIKQAQQQLADGENLNPAQEDSLRFEVYYKLNFLNQLNNVV